MTRLEKFLYANASEMIKSDTTVSRYFKIGNVTIRLSDHISTKENIDIQIIVPTNIVSSGLYTVIFANSRKTLIWNCKQLKEFIPHLRLMKEMSEKTVSKPDPAKRRTAIQKLELLQNPVEIEKPSLTFTKLINSKIHPKYASAAERAVIYHSKSHWTVNEITGLVYLLRKEFNRSDSINEDFQIFLNCTSVDYHDVINLYNIIVVENGKVPTIELLQEAFKYIR